jgi:dTMP kinase
MTDRTYGTRLPGLPDESLSGKLIVVEGADGSGRSTEVALLREWLEVEGHAVVDTGLRRSTLVAEEIDRAKQGHTLGATTMALLYAVDFADQLENKIVPALSAGSTVLADRYIYTLMARAVVRGASRGWAQRL